MNKLFHPAAVLFSLLLAGCASPRIPTVSLSRSEPAASALVAECQRASGGAAFKSIREISVRYTGRWAPIGPRFQPILADMKFRGSSEERLLIGPRIMAQHHTGPGGSKLVFRTPHSISVAYNGRMESDPEKLHAAALVADAYTMFLLGPFYFQRPGILFALDGQSAVDGAPCDQVLAVLRPGFGYADEDRVILSIDRATRQLRRVRITINGLDTTQGAEADITFRDFITKGGVRWPTDFDEQIRVPFDLHAHHWRMLGLDLNRDLTPADLRATGWTPRAAEPAAPPSTH